MELVIEAFGEVEMRRTLLRFAASAEDFAPAFKEIRAEFLAYERKQFEGQGVGPSGPWSPLAPSTLAEKQRLGIDQRILFGPTGDLMASLTEEGNEDAVFEMTPDSVFMGSDVPYGVFHQSRAARSKLPRRPPVDLDSDIKVRWVKILQAHLTSGVEYA